MQKQELIISLKGLALDLVRLRYEYAPPALTPNRSCFCSRPFETKHRKEGVTAVPAALFHTMPLYAVQGGEGGKLHALHPCVGGRKYSPPSPASGESTSGK